MSVRVCVCVCVCVHKGRVNENVDTVTQSYLGAQESSNLGMRLRATHLVVRPLMLLPHFLRRLLKLIGTRLQDTWTQMIHDTQHTTMVPWFVDPTS